MTCGALFIQWSFVSGSVYMWSHLSQHPMAFFTFIRLILIFMRRLVAGVSRRGANERSVCARWCVRACAHVTDAGGRTVIKSQPPPHLRPHQPPVALLPRTLLLTCHATRLPVVRRGRQGWRRCVCVCVCVTVE